MKCPLAAPGSDGALDLAFCCRLQGSESRVELSREEEEEVEGWTSRHLGLLSLPPSPLFLSQFFTKSL